MYLPELCWDVPLSHRPEAALLTLGTHGPHATEKFCSERHWQLHLYRYTATLRVRGELFPIRPGFASLVAPGTDMEYAFGERATHLCAHFLLPPSAAEGGGEEGGGTARIPVMQDLGDGFALVYRALEEAAESFGVHPLRAEVRLWDVLWRLSERRQGPPHAPRAHPEPVVRARQLIELRLGETLGVKQLADEVGISHNHLTRLFHAAVGDTVIGYIRTRRVERARHLLAHTTLPVKTVAAQVGVEDVRVFYKLIRICTGCSPTQLRQNSRSPATTPDFTPLP